MLDNDTDIVARLDNYLFHYTVKDGLDLGIWIKSYLYSILWRQFTENDRFENLPLTFPENWV